MSMSKRDFIALADKIREHNRIAASVGGGTPFTETQILTLAEFCGSQNPQFMRQRWLDYIAGQCGPNGGEIKDRCCLRTGHTGNHIFVKSKSKRMLGDCSAVKVS